jgi:predicted transglutaminase-like cysteine proteinase
MPTHDFSNIGDVFDFELLRGTITAINAATDTCTVTVGVDSLTALLFYHCANNSVMRDNGAIEGAARGFSVGNIVIVLKKHDNSVVKVIGHVSGIKRCVDSADAFFYISYLDGGVSKVARCTYENGVVDIIDEVDSASLLRSWSASITFPFQYHFKRFTHNVPTNGAIETRDLYFVATTMLIDVFPFAGWDTFCAANPTFPLVSNKQSTKITYSASLYEALSQVNSSVNNSHARNIEFNSDIWKILGQGDGGDCEDFALTKAQMLLNMGYPASALHIEAGYTDDDICHAWLVVQTTAGDFALDVNIDEVVDNQSLTFGTTELKYRRRQIGRNWACVSPYSWLKGAVNSNGFLVSALVGCDDAMTSMVWYLYIYDPEFNIFYHITKDYAPGALFGYFERFLSRDSGTSVNFSQSNDSIYVYGYRTGAITKDQALEIRLLENELQIEEYTRTSYGGPVTRTGATYEKTSYNDISTASPDGYYEYSLQSNEFAALEGGHRWYYWVIQCSNVFLGLSSSDDRFYWEQKINYWPPVTVLQYIYSPIEPPRNAPNYVTYHWSWMYSLGVNNPQVNLFAAPMSHIQTGDILIRAYYWVKRSLMEPKLYDQSVSKIDAFTTDIGIDPNSLRGIFYLPINT